MSLSVTKIALGVTVPLVTLAGLAVVNQGSNSAERAVRTPVAPRIFSGHRAGRNDLALLDLDTPLPTPTPAPVALAPRAAPAAASPAQRAIAPRPAVHPPASTVSGAAGVEFSLVNQDRAANGAAALSWSGSLARVAQYRAQDMLNRNYFSHYDPTTGQVAFVELLHLWGIPYTTAGENIAWSTNPSMAGINTLFMNSPEHRANILNRAYHHVGIGVASNGSKVMVVEVFSN
jgi:uncharacterized protein YkwD